MKTNQKSSKIKTRKKVEIEGLPCDDSFDSFSGKMSLSTELVSITALSAIQSSKTNPAILPRRTGWEEASCIQAWCAVGSASSKHMVWCSHNDKAT